MEIKYLGHSAFYIKTKTARIVTDPFDPSMVGLKFPKTEADIVTISHKHNDHGFKENIKGEVLFIDWPGQYEKKEVRISGYPSFHDNKQGAERGENNMYKIEAEGISVLHCGDLGHMLDEQTTENIGEVDILLVPTGGTYTINARDAVKVVSAIEPGIVIPMHYGSAALNQTNFGALQNLEVFLKEIGAEDTQPIEKLTVKKEDIVREGMKVVVLSI